MTDDEARNLALHIATYIENGHRGFDFPSRGALAGYIEDSFHDYEVQHTDQKIKIERINHA